MKKLLYSLFLLPLLISPLLAQQTEIFLKTIQEAEASGDFKTVDMDHDDDGNTYVLGVRSGGAVIVKYNSSGGRQEFSNSVDDIVISNFTPIAFDVTGGEDDGSIFVISSNSVRKYSLVSGTGSTITTVNWGVNFTDVAYATATNRLMVGSEGSGYAPVLFVYNSGGTSFQEYVVLEEAGWTGAEIARVRSLTVDDQGNFYVVGETASNTPTAPSNVWSPTSSDATSGQATLSGNTRYFAKINAAISEYTIKQPGQFDSMFEVSYNNGWVYAIGRSRSHSSNPGTSSIRVQRFDNAQEGDKHFNISNPDYVNLYRGSGTYYLNWKKFSITSDAQDNVFITGYTKSGTTKFYADGETVDPFKSIASTSESAYIAKLDFNFDYVWVKTPINSPIPSLGSDLQVSWDGVNSRLWWSGTYTRTTALTMQEASDASSARTLEATPSWISGNAGFVAVFQPDGVFTETALFTLQTDFFTDNVTFNSVPLESSLVTEDLILDSIITVQTPRIIYKLAGDKSDDIERDTVILEGADTRYSFLNFSVNNVVEDSNATTYTFSLEEPTTIKLEWLVEYSLVVDSNFAKTASAAVENDGSQYVDALTSQASGNPVPAAGKHWIEEDSPVVMEINGALEDLTLRPGLPIRFVPWRYRVTGSAGSSGEFSQVEPRQQLNEFTMSGPATVTYDWKLQYGVDIKSTNVSADPLMLVKFVAAPPTPTTVQTTSEGAGVHWYDDGTKVTIAAPQSVDLGSGPQILKGWINGDNYIFSPASGSFDTDFLETPFSAEQINANYQRFRHDLESPTVPEDWFLGREVVLDRPARLIWSYGDDVILKVVQIGDYIRFTAQEIADYGINTGEPPTLSSEGLPSGTPATASDFIWDPVAKRYFPIRPLSADLVWPSSTGTPAKVKLSVVWGLVDYKHVANTPGVSLTPRPPVGEPNDFVFERVAYTQAEALVGEGGAFTATQAGRSVLMFFRVTPAGRGGLPVNVVELRVVETKRWNTGLESTVDAQIGQKIVSSDDLAGLDTGFVFFNKARVNPFIYDSSRFVGDALWDFNNPPGPVIPVNQNPSASPANEDELVVVWYDNPIVNDHFLWPYKAVRYNPVWPTASTGLGRILMSSGFGSESVAANGSDQNVIDDITVDTVTVPAETTFDPGRFEQVQIYVQSDRDGAGYNPNEEHALMAPSLRYASVAPRPLAAYALRENDLNETQRNLNYTSDPYVLVQFLDKADNEFKMKVYSVLRADTVNYPNGFSQEMEAGEPVIPFYPIGVVSGATLCESSYAREGNTDRLTFWKDHKGTAWAVSGQDENGVPGSFSSYFFYPLSPDFWWPNNAKGPGECVAWLPDPDDLETISRSSFVEIDYTNPNQQPDAQDVSYTSVWPLDSPILKVGETLTFSGGEYAADNADALGLPGVLAWAAGEVVFDQLNPDMREGGIDEDGNNFDKYTARMFSALEERTVDLPVAQFPEVLLPATGRTEVDGAIYLFSDLSSSLKKRIFYNPLNGKLGIKGFVNEKDIANDTLTAAPPAVYALEANVLTQAEFEELNGTGEDSPFSDLSGDSLWRGKIDELFKLSRNPSGISNTRALQNDGYTVGLKPQDIRDPNTGAVIGQNVDAAQAYKAIGPGLAVAANPGFLDPFDTSLPDVSYVTLAENNDPELGGSPVILHIIKIDRRERYRGAIKVVLSDNVFDENIILRHTGDFAARADDLVFEWWYRVEDGREALPPDLIAAGETNPWKLFPDPSPNEGQGFFQLKLKGNPQAPELLLADSLWFVRYRHKDEAPLDPIVWDDPATSDAVSPEIPFQWAGAGNSTPKDLDGDGVSDYQAQLAQGWVKRVLDAVNPYEARIRDFNGDNPATYASMIRQFGQRFEGPVALNPDKNVIENVGLIELYSTVLKRARDLSIDLTTPVSTPGITNALLLASTRLADFYMLLGNEAYSDAKNPAIGFGSDSVEYGSLAPTVFTFQNQLSSQIEEELALLRGVYDFKARPVYNRLFWNFTKGEGEAAYATAYNLSDVTLDGFIDEDDAQVLFPQGHGDAWGHYLTAIRGQYELLNNPFFNWVSRSELYSLQDIVFDVDFLDERKFAQVAAAKAKAGAEIVQLTYRDNYVADPEAQWQGYLDTDSLRAWGVEGWARRAGQGAYFDWVTANALIPSEHPNSEYTGIKKVDRTTVKDIAVISSNMNAIQQTFEDANNGYNPLGIAGNTVPFDIDPSELAGGSGTTHFEQIYERALDAMANAVTVFNNANQINNMLRAVENNEIDFRRAVFEEDMTYRNELIEIFGTPYYGTIGSGAAFPAGYDGPDTTLYMYVDKQSREISTDTVPGITAAFASDLTNIEDDFSDFISAEFRSDYAPSFSSDEPADWSQNFNGVNYITTGDDGITFDTGSARVGLTNIQLPIKASGYSFEAPSDWGQRSSPGQLQQHISKMIQQEAAMTKAIAEWDGYTGEIVRQIRLISAQYFLDDYVQTKLKDKIDRITTFGQLRIAGLAVVDVFKEVSAFTNDTNEFLKDYVPGNLPTGGFAISPGAALKALRGTVGTVSTVIQVATRALKVAGKTAVRIIELNREIRELNLDRNIDDAERDLALKQSLVELENMVGDEGVLRIEVFRQQEALRELSEGYRALLLRGARLLDEREAYNKRVAELVQRNRYQDMTFRVSRNAALQRYHEAFDLAARYTYLAAKAYDYETNLHPDDAGSAQGILSNIVGARGLGHFEIGFEKIPFTGKGGLSEELAKLKANFDVLKGQLGLNNPQTETGRFSLRQELYRISAESTSDQAWSDTLEDAKVDNLWDLPEFRRYCRPFAAYDPDSPEPGIVIEFPSEIMSGRNFFGRSLAGGDNAYDPTNFSTKVLSVGAWFEGYLSSATATDLSETPRIYLVPVGSDRMMYPSDTDLGVRTWDVLDQKIPVPYPILQANLDDNAWRPIDTLGGTDGEIRKFSSFRAYHDSGFFDESEMTFDSRLVGRSVWNTRWLLIIPGATLNADSEDGLQTFIDNISDIKLFFQTYGFSGN
ncbi:MAG: hypothetical protein ACSHX4_02075 [Opitutaceae bacterium]